MKGYYKNGFLCARISASFFTIKSQTNNPFVRKFYPTTHGHTPSIGFRYKIKTSFQVALASEIYVKILCKFRVLFDVISPSVCSPIRAHFDQHFYADGYIIWPQINRATLNSPILFHLIFYCGVPLIYKIKQFSLLFTSHVLLHNQAGLLRFFFFLLKKQVKIYIKYFQST